MQCSYSRWDRPPYRILPDELILYFSSSFCGAALIKSGYHLTLPERSTLSSPRLPGLTMTRLSYLLPQGPLRIIHGSSEVLLLGTGNKHPATTRQRLATLSVNRNHNRSTSNSNKSSPRIPPPSTWRSSQSFNIIPSHPTYAPPRHRRVRPAIIWSHLVMLSLATSRRHKGCSSSSNNSTHLILTLTIGETCSRRSVTNNRWK